MIEFFELLNKCSPFRAGIYLLFTFLIIFTVLGYITLIIKNLFGKDKKVGDLFTNYNEYSDSE